MKEQEKKLSIFSKDFFSDNFDEYKEYIETLNYFQGHSKNASFLKRVAEITNKNPYELMLLHKYYLMLLEDNKNKNKNFDFENLENKYFERKLVAIKNLDEKFIQEYILDKSTYKNLVQKLDTEIQLEEYDLKFVNPALMETENGRVYSLCPAVKKYYKAAYHVLLEKDKKDE